MLDLIPKRIYIKDIRQWEEDNRRNILDLFDDMSMTSLVTLLTIFNKNVTESEIYQFIDDYLEHSQEGNGYFNLFVQLRDTMLGYPKLEHSDENETADDENDEDNDSDEYLEDTDISEYKYLSDFYQNMVMQLMSLGISYTEAWSFSTYELYSVYISIQKKMVYEFNQRMEEAYIQAALNSSAFWGKLPKQPPRIENKNRTIKTEHGEMDIDTYQSMLALKNLKGDGE